MELTCYLHKGWRPKIRPAEPTRPWMDNSPERFAYRCLPLNIANAHGWEILAPHGASAYWTGGGDVADVVVQPDPGASADAAPVSLFGQGVLTFHIFGLFRTPPGWNLWVGGSPNRPKDAIYPLSGIIETDWAPYTFTMNWRFTRRYRRVRFERDEPICFLFPVQRTAIETVEPVFRPIDSNPDLREQFDAWSRSRDAFQAEVAKSRPAAPTDRWQKRYYRGVDMQDHAPVDDHQAKLRLRPFASPPEEGEVP